MNEAMTEVTRSSFEEVFPKVEKAIQNSTFIAIDAEFTGLSLGAYNELSYFDSLEERYQKLKVRASSFIPCQIGLSTFTKHASKNTFLVETYVFYICPHLSGSTDRCFSFQASSAEFLSQYDFDFNKFFKEGIPYINEFEEEKIQKEINDGSISYSHKQLLDIRSTRCQDMLINNKFINALQDGTSGPLDNISDEEKTYHSGKENDSKLETEKIILEKGRMCNEYFQLNELRHKYPSLWAYADCDKIVVEKVPVERRKVLQQTVKEEQKRLLNFFLGFTRVFRKLKEMKKPIIGHNLLMDLLLFFHNFHRPLPKTYKQFKKELCTLFPVVYDTRHIWRHVKKYYKLKDIPKHCGLFDLYDMLKNPPPALVTLYSPGVEHINGEKYANMQYPHESGYDSFITGWVFLKICHVLAMKRIISSVHVQPQSMKLLLQAVAPFVNKINLGKSSVSYINLDGEDPVPAVPELLHIRGRNKDIVLNEMLLSRIFDKYGMIDIKLMGNKKTAIIAVGSLRSYRDILQEFENDSELIISKYDIFKHSQVVNSALWLTALSSGCIVAFLIYKLVTGR